jgi:acetyl esterase/lipase
VSVSALIEDITERMDEELRAAFVRLPPAVDATLDPPAARLHVRETLVALRRDPNPAVARRDLVVPGSGDNTAGIPIRVYEPAARTGILPAILYIHGGGFVVGAIDDFESLCEGYAEHVDAVVVAVDYRLAPEHPFPAATQDAYAALLWLAGAAEELGTDPTRIAVAGHSAGGGITAAVALMARDRAEVELALQAPICACLDDRHTTPSSQAIGDPRTWNRARALRAWAAYLGAERDDISPLAAPARADDLAGLPPTFMTVGDLDLVRDENLDYARRLVEAGVPTELHLYAGAFHGFELIAPAARLSQAATTALNDALRRALHPFT